MSEQTPTDPHESHDPGVEADDDRPALTDLVGAWLTVPDVAERLGLSLRTVHRMIDERELLTHRIPSSSGRGTVLAVPELFLRGDELLPALPGTFTVLGDAGLDDEDALRWLFTPDATLPLPGAPIDMLQAGRKAEVRKRAQELA